MRCAASNDTRVSDGDRDVAHLLLPPRLPPLQPEEETDLSFDGLQFKTSVPNFLTTPHPPPIRAIVSLLSEAMLFPDPAAKSATIALVIDRDEYVAGDVVRGSVLLTIKERLECTSIMVVALGLETANWNYDPAPSMFRTRENVCFKQEIMVSPAKRVFEPGEHSCPFECTLPLVLPGSFTLPSTSTPRNVIKFSAASIQYKLHAAMEFFTVDAQPSSHGLVPPRTHRVHTEHGFIVHETHPELSIASQQDAIYDAPVRSCCFRSGKVHFKATISHDAFFPGDRVEVSCDVKNDSPCTITAVTCRLIQVVTLRLNAFDHTVEHEVGAWMYRAIAPRERVVRPHVFAIESSSGHQVVVEPTTTNGSIAQCRYEIVVEAYLPGSPDLELRLPITVVSQQHQVPTRESSI